MKRIYFLLQHKKKHIDILKQRKKEEQDKDLNDKKRIINDDKEKEREKYNTINK